MSCLNEGYEEESIIFEKIGWGQWSAKRVPKEDFIKERNLVRVSNAKVKDDDHNSSANKDSSARRSSITTDKYAADQHEKFLKAKQEQITNDFAILSDEEEESDSDFDDEDDEGVFKFDDDESIPPLKLNGRLISPPLTTSSSRRQSRGGITKPSKAKRSNSQTPTAPDAKFYTSNKSNINRRRSSIRSTLGDSLSMADDEAEDTDEEDWATIGAIRLLKNSNAHPNISIPRTHEIPTPQGQEFKKDEQDAAYALVNLRSI